MNTTAPKPVFLYLKDCPLSDRQLKKIKEAGYLTVPVASFDAVRIVEPALLVRSDPIAQAAFHTLATTLYETPVTTFGRLVAKALWDNTGS